VDAELVHELPSIALPRYGSLHQRLEVVVEHFFPGVRERLELHEHPVELVFGEVVSDLLEALSERMPPAVLAEDEGVVREPDVLGLHDLVGEPVLDDAVLMDPGLVGEGVLTDDGLVALHHEPSHLREEPARGIDAPGVDAGLEVEEVGAGPERHHHFLERAVPRALADPVDGALDLTRAGTEGREAVGNGEPEVVVAVHAHHRSIDVGDVHFQIANSLRELFGNGVAHGVGDVHRGRSGVDRPFHHFGEEVELGPGRVFGRELDVLAELSRHLDALHGAPHDLLFGHRELVLAMDGARREKDVDTGSGRVLESVPGTMDVELVAARESRDRRALDAPGDLPDRLEVAVRGDGKARFDDVDSELRERSRHRKLCLEAHAGAGGLFAISQRRIENDNSIRIGHDSSLFGYRNEWVVLELVRAPVHYLPSGK
jgi:hypothetical protein